MHSHYRASIVQRMDNKKILIIDDDPLTRDLYRDVFSMAGFTTDFAEDGEQGLAKLKIGGWDCVLLDVMMPKMDGLQVLKALKDSPPAAPNGPIILLTNLAQEPIVTEGLANGAKTFFLKSEFNPDELVDKVKAIL